MGRETTSYLKGVAVMVILFAHYANYYATGIYPWEQGFGYSVVSIFFVLSGLGIFFSLKRRLGEGRLGIGAITRFLLDRAIRIFPLYWLALFLTSFYFPEYRGLHHFSFDTVAIYLGFFFVRPPGLFWFVAALIQCYLLAPLFYLALTRFHPVRYLQTNLFLINFTLLLTILLLLSYRRSVIHFDVLQSLNALTYRYLPLGHLFLFSLGMVIPPLVTLYRKGLANRAYFYISLIVFLTSAYLARHTDDFFQNSGYYFSLIMMLSVFGLCLFAVSIRLRLPIPRAFAPVGDHAYPFYLFHMLFFALLAALGIIKDMSITSFVVMLILLPAYYGTCVLMDRVQSACTDVRPRQPSVTVTDESELSLGEPL